MGRRMHTSLQHIKYWRIPPVISSQPSSFSSYSPLNTNKINLIFRIWARPRRQDRKSGGEVACITNAVKHCFKSAWLGERRDSRQKGGPPTPSQSLFESIKSKQSFLYKIHHTGLLSQQHFPLLNIPQTQHEKYMSFRAFFHHYWCISNRMRLPLLLLLSCPLY